MNLLGLISHRLPSQDDFNSLEISGQSLNVFRGIGQDKQKYLSLWRNRNVYGNFMLTDAVRPVNHYGLFSQKAVIPREGFGVTKCYTGADYIPLPAMRIAITAEAVADLFTELVNVLGPEQTVTTYNHPDPNPNKHTAKQMETMNDVSPRQLSKIVHMYSDFIVNDGMLTLETTIPDYCVRLARDKSILLYGLSLNPFQQVLSNFGLRKMDNFRTILDGGAFFYEQANREILLKLIHSDIADICGVPDPGKRKQA